MSKFLIEDWCKWFMAQASPQTRVSATSPAIGRLLWSKTKFCGLQRRRPFGWSDSGRSTCSVREVSKMTGRIWHGWTKFAHADSYESLLKTEIFIGIQKRRISGYRGNQLFRRTLQDEVEFITVMWFGARSQQCEVRAEMRTP